MINKNENQNLQITITKENFKNLNTIKEILKLKLGVEFTKSKIIEYLIQDFIKNQN